MIDAASRADERLVRAIGFPALTANIVNMTIGAGIFVLPAVAVANLGPAAPLAYVVCAVLMGSIVACFAAAGSRVSLTGGLYAYIEVAFGPFPGFLAGVLFWLMATFAVASVASAFAGSIGAMVPALSGPAARAAIILTAEATLAAINVRGVTSSAGLVQAVTAAKLLPLAVFVAVGIWHVDAGALRWTEPVTLAALGRTCMILIYAFAGVEVALVPTGEVRDPTRTVPRALFTALSLTTIFYLLIQSVAQGLLGPSMSAYASAPLAEAASRVLGAGGRTLVLVGGTISMFGYLSGDMLGSPRALYAFGRDRLLPPGLARIHPRFRTPHVAIVVHALIITTLAVSSSFTQLAVLATIAALTLYLTSVLASLELRRRDVRSGGTPLNLPGGPLIPGLAVVVILWMMSHATAREIAVEIGVLAAAAAVYGMRRAGGQS